MGFFDYRRNLCLAVEKSINRYQFETGFSPRGGVWVGETIDENTHKKKRRVRPRFWPSCLSLFNCRDNSQLNVSWMSIVPLSREVPSAICNQSRHVDKNTGSAGRFLWLPFCLWFFYMLTCIPPKFPSDWVSLLCGESIWVVVDILQMLTFRNNL